MTMDEVGPLFSILHHNVYIVVQSNNLSFQRTDGLI
jgi:hypothetical protein